MIRRAAEQQDINLRALNEQIAGLKAEVVKLQAEREKADQVAAEHARSTAKGRPYEEAVVDALENPRPRARYRVTAPTRAVAVEADSTARPSAVPPGLPRAPMTRPRFLAR